MIAGFSTYEDTSAVQALSDYAPAMDAARIDGLLELLPVEWFISIVPIGTSDARRLQEAGKRRAQLPRNPAFGWRLVELYVLHGEPLPWQAMDESLLHAHEFLLTGRASPELSRVLAIAGNRHLAAATRALLTCADTDLAAVANWLRVPEQVVQWFAVLLWNAAFRRDEPAYLLSVVFPDGLRGAWDEDRHATLEQFLLQTAYTGGQRAVMQAMGARSEGGEAASLSDLEALTVGEAMKQARQGGLTRRPTTAMREAFRLMQAQKLHHLRYGDPDNDPDRDSLMAVGRRFAVLDQVKAMQSSRMKEFINSQRDMHTDADSGAA